MQKEYDWIWQEKRKIKNQCEFNKIQKALIKTLKKKTGLNQSTINSFLSCCPNFIGCFGQDELKKLKLKSFPLTLIVNTENSFQKGSHWIMIYISKKYIEVFCPLGFQVLKYSTIPCDLLDFLHLHSRLKTIRVFKRVQSDSSRLCGYFCVLFTLLRQHLSFSFLHSKFVSVVQSRRLLIKFLKYAS